MDTISGAAVAYLSGVEAVTSLLGTFTDPTNSGEPYLFDSDILVTLEGTSQAAVVLTSAGIMQTPPQLGSQRFERLSVEIYADPQRDSDRNVIVSSALTIQRVEAIFSQVHAVLQRLDPDLQVWGDMVTASCQLLAENQAMPVSDGDLMQRKQAFYGVLVTGWTDVVLTP